MKKNIIHSLSWQLVVRLVALFCIFLGCSIGFVAIAEEVHEGETLLVDEAILKAINHHSSSFWDTFFSVVTNLGGVIGVITLTLGIGAFLVVRRKYRKAILLAAGVGGAALINIILKFIFERARPDLWEQLVVETSFSFPSGHSMASSALAFSVMAILWNTKYRWLAVILGSLFVIVIGFSRLYLGVHYPTDVLAGWLVSGVWVLLVVFILNGKRTLQRVLHP